VRKYPQELSVKKGDIMRQMIGYIFVDVKFYNIRCMMSWF